ncbi:MAG: glutathione peroxidase [bacterium]
MKQSFYDFQATSLQGELIGMDSYKGKVVLVVNTASKCGFTPQYEGLQELHESYRDKGLEILGFPCNQFGKQEPGGKAEIESCLVNYGVDFQMFEKVKVNGKEAHPIFKHLKSKLPGTLGKRIKWNFTKFLIDSNGHPIKRFAPAITPAKLEKEIKRLIRE